MTEKPELLRLAKFLTGSNDIDELITAASKLDRYSNASEIANTYKHPLLTKVQSDAADFASTLAIQHPTRGAIPFGLYDFQRKSLRTLQMSADKTIGIASARQMGWSTLIAASTLHYALTRDRTTQMVMLPRFASAYAATEKIRFMVQSRPDLTIQQSKKSDIIFPNGSSILFRAASEDSIRGLCLDRTFIMDAAYVSYKKLEELIIALAPVQATGGQVIMQSTPNKADDPFGKFYTSAELKIHQPWNLHPDRDQAWKDKISSQMGPAGFEQEYTAMFIK